jgi:ubiquinone/menaquinone biosynthesis C-methylase UbiE
LLYNELAWAYDLVAWLVSFGQWKVWGRAAIPRLRGPRVLEIAHGPGHLLVAMHRAGLEPVGLDFSPQMGRLARAKLRRASPAMSRRVDTAKPAQAVWSQSALADWPSQSGVSTPGLFPGLVRARAQAMPFRAGSFDSVVSTFPAEFIFDPATLQEIARVMKPEGRAVVVIGVTFKQGWPARLLRWLYRVTYQDEPAPPGVADAIAEAGLTLEREREPVGMVDVLIAVAVRSTSGRDGAS